MNKKAIIAVLSALVLTIVASVTLILTVGQKASANTGIVTVPVEYLKINNGVLEDGGFTPEGKEWIKNKKYRVEIPEGVTSMSEYAFYGLDGLVSLTIPANLTSIGEGDCGMFDGCKNLVSIVVNPNNPTYTSRDADGNECNCIIEKSSNVLIAGCNSTIIPFGVTEIRHQAFYGTGLTSVVIPSSVKTIGYESFSSCENLTSVIIPSSVDYVGPLTFYGLGGDTENSNNSIIYCECSREYADEHWAKSINYWNEYCYAEIFYNSKIITFNTDGGSLTESQAVSLNGLANKPSDPIKDGYEFKGWFVGDDEYDFTSPVTNSMTLTARWEAIPEPEPSNPEPTEPENQEQNNETTPTEQENTEMKGNKNNDAVIAAIAGTTAGVVSLIAVGTIVGVVLKRRRK